MKMLLKFGFLVSLPLLLNSCVKSEVASNIAKYTEIDEAKIEKLNSEQALGLIKDETGVYYKKTKESPTGRILNETFVVNIVYTLKTFEGEVLLKATSADSILVNFYTTQSFQGFYNSLVLLKEGEKGVFYIPSTLAYQDQPISGLDAWEPVILEMEVPKIYNEEEQIVAYFEKINVQPDTTTFEGLRAVFLTEVQGGEPAAGKKNVSVRYTGSLLSGTIFDSGNFDVALGEKSLIVGFEEAILLMKVGEKAEFVFPSILGYGVTGSGQTIPPHSPLKFEIELTAINNK
ncbi:FKBP-type peptidyl-prolyl cis-trans isomerase [Spirosomataceae bacterium TFI 002]|nr:FKBP-type peptidyl-prolyl cis-trans isomerase [Spirosomataceae bacterium TFI 002]